MVYAHHVGGPQKQCKTTGFYFCKRTQTTGTEAKIQSVVCSEVTPLLNKHLENGRAVRLTTLHYRIGGFH